MKILYVSGLFYPASGGAEVSMNTILCSLAEHGHTIIIVTQMNSSDLSVNPFKNFKIVSIQDTSDLLPTLCVQLNDHPDIGLIITQSSWCDKAIIFGREKNIPVVYFLRSCFGNLDISIGGAYQCDYVFANSKAVKQYIKEQFGREDVYIIPPIINATDYQVDHWHPAYVTFVNPVVHKGAETFEKIATALAQMEFLVVGGWSHLKIEGNWDSAKLADLAASFNVAPFVPTEVALGHLPNVRVLPNAPDMREIYCQTRLLLVPSIVPEGGPRVAIEAMINGIPVIGSDLGTIPSIVGDGGIIISDYLNVDRWVDAIRSMEDSKLYLEYSSRARRMSQKFLSENSIQPLLDVIRTL